METMNINLKTARNLCKAIMYCDEQIVSSDIAVYANNNDDAGYDLNRALNDEMTSFAYSLLNRFRSHINVQVIPGCISMNREEEYVRTAQRAYMFWDIDTQKIEVIKEEDDKVYLVYYR